MRTHSYLSLSPCGFHRIQYQEWGLAHNPRVVICVHGLARHSRDFDELAKVLAKDYRVICPDLVGRGHSDRLQDSRYYTVPQYTQDMATLLAHLQITQAAWIGCSLGGLIGAILASMPLTPIKALLLNDVGPFIGRAALEGLIQQFLAEPVFHSLPELEAYYRKNYASWGKLSDAQWRYMAEHDHIVATDSTLKRLYDPKIIDNMLAHRNEDLNLWAAWPHVHIPTLLLHGTQSELLTPDIITGMHAIKPQLEVVEIPECGHMPSLMVPEQHELVSNWLARTY